MKMLALSTLVGIAAFAAPAYACGGNQCEPQPYMGGRFVELELGGLNFGEGLAGAEASGATTETMAGVIKTGSLKLDGNIFGTDDGCEVDCGSFGGSFTGIGSEHLLSEAGAIASGTDSALAGVANSGQVGLGLMGRIRIGSAEAE